MVIAYQGEPGAFSDDAARRLVAGARTRGYRTFDDAAAAVQGGHVDAALLPVENSISGSVPRVYDLLWSDERLGIVDEIVYRVVQNLVGTPDSSLERIREVRSHPVALEQCRSFLSAHPWMASVIVADTAGAVAEIARLGDPGLAAIASSAAAARYGAKVLAQSIQDVDDNFTRFFLLQAEPKMHEAPTRACVALSLAHRPGSLRDALAAFADLGLNLRALVSRPSLEEPFTYRFYCEIVGIDAGTLERAVSRIDGTTRIMGLY